jgi:hypothetical protein
VREKLFELRPGLLRGDDHDLHVAQPTHQPVEGLRDLVEVLAHLRLDVALIARLRPAPLVVATGLLLGVISKILEAASAQAVEMAELAADHDDERPLAAPDQRHERSQVQHAADLDLILHGFGERQGPPDVVEAGRKDGEALRPVALELVCVVGADALEIVLQPEALVVRQVAPVGAIPLGGLVEQRVQPRDGVTRRGRHARIEAQVEADRAALLRLEARQVS